MTSMLSFLTSLSFLYGFTIALLLLYGWSYYRRFIKNRYQARHFPWVLLLVALACFFFLYSNTHAPLSLKTFSNLDHHFIRQDGFVVNGQIELGKSDTSGNRNRSYNRFLLQKKDNTLRVVSAYSEEPFYIASGDSCKLASASYPAEAHQLSFYIDSTQVSIKGTADSGFELFVDGRQIAVQSKQIAKGISAWDLFKDHTAFINSPAYTQENLTASLKEILLLRDELDGAGKGQIRFFIPGSLFQDASQFKYDSASLTIASTGFSAVIPDQSTIGWGLGFPANNKNQLKIHLSGADSFSLANKYPLTYPLQEEDREDWTAHTVTKFLVADSKDLQQMPAVFGEGFLFTAFNGDSTLDFAPVLLSYRKDRSNEPLQLQAATMNGRSVTLAKDNRLLLVSRSAQVSWVFSVSNSLDWSFGSKIIRAESWQWMIYGSLFFFFLMVFTSAWLRPADQLSWIWQLLSCVTMVLLTTRFFLYWRYKSFPPYEGLDLPSLQQLNSFWNFGIIVMATVVLAIVFGYDTLRHIYHAVRKSTASLFKQHYDIPRQDDLLQEEKIAGQLNKIPFIKNKRAVWLYFGSWLLILLLAAAFASFTGFDPAICRHLAIVLVLLYFLFLYLSYKYSPLVTSAGRSWWSIHTARSSDILVSNPVKIILSISLLGLFAFVDIGFAIVFLNFLFFNEAFLCINYAGAGLSAGSKKNAALFGMMAMLYMAGFVVNLVYAPYIFKNLLELPQTGYTVLYGLFALLVAFIISRLIYRQTPKKKIFITAAAAIVLFITAFLFFPKDRILEKAAMTRYRIDVMTMTTDAAIQKAYAEGKTYEPVIRAAQNQWFINTFIYEKNNPAVNSTAFHLLPHAPQNKGARYNAQATDLVTSRFIIAEHGRWAVLLYVLLLLVPSVLLASFYKLYPDFTNRINNGYPTVITGFSLLNYLLVTALLVILAATGRYIFFGQDLPFGSILSKQSILFPSVVLTVVVLLFRRIPLEQYPDRKKLLPGFIVFAGLGLLLFFIKPMFNRDRQFAVTDLARDMDSFVELRLQPVFDHFDTAKATRRLPMIQKDQLFSDSARKLIETGLMDDAGSFFVKEIEAYARAGFARHLDQAKMLYLDLYSGKPRLAVNDNFFRIEAPPHLQQSWAGNIYSDSSNYNVTLWNEKEHAVSKMRISSFTNEPAAALDNGLQLVFKKKIGENWYDGLCLVNHSSQDYTLPGDGKRQWHTGDTILLANPCRIRLTDSSGRDRIIQVQPDAFMKNFYVNGSRFYVYPMGAGFIWARNFAESISSEYAAKGERRKNVVISLDAEMTDTLSSRMRAVIGNDTAYKNGAEYGLCIADGNGRLLVMNDLIKGLERPDPNDKAGFNKVVRGGNGFVSQSLLRKQIGNINLLRMNPGPGSTLKPIVFTAIASQLAMNWDAFAAEGFSQKQQFFGGEKVGEYDFEKNNGKITSVVDYLRYSDNYYHSNLLLLGSYSKQDLQHLLTRYFAQQNPESGFHWPYFNYNGKQYWLNGFENWPGYVNGKANFGSDSSFVSVGLFNNYGIYTYRAGKAADRFSSDYDSALFREAYKRSGFILPEYALFDQKGAGMDHGRPNEVFLSSFRGHVKGSSQVMIPPVKMLDAFGKMTSQNRNYSLTLNPYAAENPFESFYVDNGVRYSDYLSIIREKVFEGMKQALFSGTAARLGSMLKNGAPYYYYAKTGTTGDDASDSKSKLFVIIISQKDITKPGFSFRKNRFYTLYFTSQNGPAKQNEEFQAAVIRYVQRSPAFIKYMSGDQ